MTYAFLSWWLLGVAGANVAVLYLGDVDEPGTLVFWVLVDVAVASFCRIQHMRGKT